MSVEFKDSNIKITNKHNSATMLKDCMCEQTDPFEKFFYEGHFYNAQMYADERRKKVYYKSYPKFRNEHLLKGYHKQMAKEYDPFTDIEIQLVEEALNKEEKPIKIHQEGVELNNPQ